MPSGCDECRGEMGSFWHAMGNLHKEIQTLHAEQLEANEQLLSGLSEILIEARRPRRTTTISSRSASLTHVDAPGQSARSRQTPPSSSVKDRDSASVESKKSQQSQSIPGLIDLDKKLLRESSLTSVRPAAPNVRQVQPELHPVLQADPHAPTITAFSRRGSELKVLARDSQSRILTPRSKDFARNFFQENIGVRLWLNWSNFTSISIVLLNLTYLVPTTLLQVWRHEPGNYFATFDLLMYSIVAILLLQRVKQSLRSEELNVALQKLEEFVDNCGQGLDWPSVSKTWWRRSLALWLLVLLAFVVEQALEVWKTAGTALDESFASFVNLQILKAFTSSMLFAVCSAVVMHGAYCQFTLLLGLGKTLDCWCADLMEDQDFIAGINSWNSLQALLKSVGREVTPAFLALYVFGYAGFLAAVVGSVSLLLDPNLDGSTLALYESSLLPLIYLFVLSARLLTSGAGLSEKCQQIPAFVNQLSCGPEPDADRQYLVHYVSNSRAGFIVYGVTLSQTALLKQAHVLFALCTGVVGILMRRFL